MTQSSGETGGFAMLSAMMKGLQMDVDDSRAEMTYMDVLSDPLRYLREKEKQQWLQLERLTEEHRGNLIGHRNVNATRQELLRMFADMEQAHRAMREIYTTERAKKQARIDQFTRRRQQREELQGKVKEIETGTPEGKNYTNLVVKTGMVDQEIELLEQKLATLRNKRRLLQKEMLESKSLLDIKANPYVDALGELEEREKMDIRDMQRRGSIPKATTTGDAALENLTLQSDADADMMANTQATEEKLRDSIMYLHNVFDSMAKLEQDLMTLIEEDKTDRVMDSLKDTKDFLCNQMEQCERFKLDKVTPIVVAELDAIRKALTLLGVKEEKSPTESFESVRLPLTASETSLKSGSPAPPVFTMNSFAPMKQQQSVGTVDNTVARGSTSDNGPQKQKKYAELIKTMKKAKGSKKD